MSYAVPFFAWKSFQNPVKMKSDFVAERSCEICARIRPHRSVINQHAQMQVRCQDELGEDGRSWRPTTAGIGSKSVSPSVMSPKGPLGCAFASGS